jgi:hypothetical protein
MKMVRLKNLSSTIAFTMLCGLLFNTVAMADPDYHRSRWDPIHFKPAIDEATDADCLACHQAILERKPLEKSPAGVVASESKAWYQAVSTYEGEQDTFHRRHLVGPMAEKYMDMSCTTCHQGNDPREETVGSSNYSNATSGIMRKMVDPDICLMCHGQFPYEVMTGLTGPWTESGELFGNNCMGCHAAFRTVRHQVNFLKPEAIEADGSTNGDVCYGCHGGRAWFRIPYPYARNAWPGMSPEIPEWAKTRPTESDPRFLVE